MSEQQRALISLYQKFGRAYAKDSIIFFENEQGEEMYIILSGKVEILKRIPVKTMIEKAKLKETEFETLAILSAGDFFGEMSLLNDKPRSATARALEPTKVIVLNKENFELILEKQPKLSLKILKTLSNRIRNLDKLLEKEDSTSQQQIAVETKFTSQETIQEILPKEDREEISLQEEAEDRFEVEQYTNYYRSKIFLTALDLDIFKILSSEISTVEKLSEKINCKSDILELFLNLLVNFGLLQKEQDFFYNSPSLKNFIETKSNLAEEIKFENQLFEKWCTLDKILKDGVENLQFDHNIFRKMLSKFSFNFQNALENLVSTVNLGWAKRFFEIGENPGVYAIDLIKRFPQANVNVMDRSDTIHITDEYIAQFTPDDRINCQIGDYKDNDFGKNYDVILLSCAFHQSYDTCIDIIFKANNALNSGGYLVIHDIILKDNKTEPEDVASASLPFLVQAGARIYTISEIKKILEEVRFEIISAGILNDSSSLLIAKTEK